MCDLLLSVPFHQLGEYSYADQPDTTNKPQGRREVRGGREEREEREGGRKRREGGE